MPATATVSAFSVAAAGTAVAPAVPTAESSPASSHGRKTSILHAHVYGRRALFGDLVLFGRLLAGDIFTYTAEKDGLFKHVHATVRWRGSTPVLQIERSQFGTPEDQEVMFATCNAIERGDAAAAQEEEGDVESEGSFWVTRGVSNFAAFGRFLHTGTRGSNCYEDRRLCLTHSQRAPVGRKGEWIPVKELREGFEKDCEWDRLKKGPGIAIGRVKPPAADSKFAGRKLVYEPHTRTRDSSIHLVC